MQRSFGFPGWCAICRWTAVGAISVGTMAVLGAATSDHRPAPTVVRLAAQPEGTGLDWPGWTVRDPAEQRRSLDLLLNREKDRRAAARKAAAASIVSRTAAAPVSPSSVAIPQSALGQGTTLAAPQAVSVAIRYALAQVGKPYLWGATGPDSYDCSGLVQRSYAMAGVALPRTSREQARVGKAVELPDLLPGDLLFWAYDPSDLSTVHHVALYLGDGKIVQAPQPGEFVEVTTMWLSGYAGAVRVATGPATAALPPVPVGVPGTGITPVGDAMPDGSPPPPALRSAESPPRIQHRSGASSQAGTTSPDGTPATSAPGSTSPGSTSPGTTSPGTTSPGTSSPGTSSPGGSTAGGTTSPGTTSPGTSAPGGSSPAGSQQPSGSTSGTGSPATSSAAPDPTTPAPTSSEPHSSAPAPPPSSTPPPTTPAPPSTTPPPPAPSPSADATSDSAAPAATTSDPPKPSVSPSSPTPSPT
ncbi:MAG TPA: NlpC/P60 family protein [Mycobacteriales bacterium]